MRTRLVARQICLFALLVTAALANTEKAIFLAPKPIAFPDASPNLDALQLDIISQSQPTLRKAQPVAFPSKANPKGLDSWFILQGLNAGQRYEVRICWVAVQPTSFWIDVYNITHVFDTPNLIQSLASYAEQQQASQLQASTQQEREPKDKAIGAPGTTLFLHVRSAADFFTTNKTLMQHPPSVDVDIILDPYLANIFPASLVPTAIYILVLAVLSWFLSGAIWNYLHSAKPKQHTD